MTWLKWLAVAAVAYGALVAIMALAQRSLMYFPETARTPPTAVGLPSVMEEILDSEGGARIVVWWSPPRDGRPTVLYLHGNGGALRHRAPRFRALTERGLGLVAVSYRGFGGSTGRPSEEGLIADASAAYDFAIARGVAPASLVLWGESLGTGVAVALAAERPVGRLVLQAPYVSAVALAARSYPFVPVRWLMHDQFRSDLRIEKVAAPVLVIHGERDRIVPFEHGERLFAMVRSEKRFIRLPEAGHNDLDRHGATPLVLAIIDP